MASKLLTDILSLIFEELELEEENSTLYSVKREWCQVAVPILWRNPWKKFGIQQEVNKNIKLFKCFLLMMSKESKEFLKINGINLFIEHASQNNNSLQIPLFNYASFCKVIDSIQINIMICDYCNNIKQLTNYQQHLIEQEILKLLISNTSKIKTLKLHKSHPIASFPNSFISLSQLNELHCYTSVDASVFLGLLGLLQLSGCKNLERLVIVGWDNDNYGLILLIEQQFNLKRVKMQENCENYAKPLITKSNIIELDLELTFTMTPNLLKKFQKNLTIFTFNIPYSVSGYGCVDKLKNVLEEISLPNLQQLIINESYGSPFSIMTKIIEKTSGQLKKIDFGPCYHHCNENVDVVVSAIAKHCPKLELLTVWVNDNGLDKLIELIKKCKNLRGLVLQPIYSNQNAVKLFNSSNLLRQLQLSGNWKFSKEALNEFFENWYQQQRSALDFYVACDYKYEDIIKKYQELGVIRKFDRYMKIH